MNETSNKVAESLILKMNLQEQNLKKIKEMMGFNGRQWVSAGSKIFKIFFRILK